MKNFIQNNKIIGPIYHDAIGPYILRRSFKARNGKIYSNKVYKIHL